MSEQRHPGPHPDADQLNAFMEGALSAEAREESLAHLAECAECRNIVFLAQIAVPQAPAKEPAVTQWRLWIVPITLTGSAIAAALLVALWIRPHPSGAPAQHEVAIAQPPAVAPSSAPVPEAALQQPATKARPKKEHSGERTAPVGHSRTLHTGAPQESIPTGVIGGTFGRNLQVQGFAPTRPAPASANSAGEAVLPPAKAAQPAQTNGAATRSPAASPQIATGLLVTAPPANSLSARNNMLDVRVEPDEGPADGLSEVKGTVTDPSGAAIPGATISLLSAANATTALATTGKDGQFALAAVVPGHYELQVNAQGFITEDRPIDLHARDLALLTPVLKVGAAAQSVAVATNSNMVVTTTTTTDATIADIVPALPSGLPAATIVARKRQMLALDQAGALFLSRNAGKHWKKIKPAWPGAIAQLGLAAQAGSTDLQSREAAEKTAPLFQITTTTGAVWLSGNGVHWRSR